MSATAEYSEADSSMAAKDIVNRVLLDVVQQHAEETQHLLIQRQMLLRAGGVPFLALERVDERIAAHVDGLRVAGLPGREASAAITDADEIPFAARFADGVLALEAGDALRAAILAERTGEAGPDAGMLDALSWVSAADLRGLVVQWLTNANPVLVQAALVACERHHVDPFDVAAQLLARAHDGIRRQAVRCAGSLGRLDALPACRDALVATDVLLRFEAARAGVLLGDRTKCLEALTKCVDEAPMAIPALRTALVALPLDQSRQLLKSRAAGEGSLRILIEGCGLVGDPSYVPWLLKRCAEPPLARLAGESLTLITGLVLAQGFDVPGSATDREAGATEQDAVEVDADEGLPWPDLARVSAWWGANKSRFSEGMRCFMGAPPTREHCIGVLKTGFQRQRAAAALHLCLLSPGTPLFNTAAPAWRQQRLLARLT